MLEQEHLDLAIYNLAEQHAALDKFQVVLIPYKGLSVATTALIGGENLLYIWGSRPECEKMRPYTNTILYTYRESLLPYKLDKLNFVKSEWCSYRDARYGL